MQPLPPPNRGASSSSPPARNGTHQQSESRPPLKVGPSEAPSAMAAPQSSQSIPQASSETHKKRRRHRGNKKKKGNRRQSFIAPSDAGSTAYTSNGDVLDDPLVQVPEDEHVGQPVPGSASRRRDFYQRRSNFSGDSLDSEALLDHREQPSMRPRRDSRLLPSMFAAVSGQSPGRSNSDLPTHGYSSRRGKSDNRAAAVGSTEEDDDAQDATDRTPLISGAMQHKSPTETTYGLYRNRSRDSRGSSKSRNTKKRSNILGTSFNQPQQQEYDVNNPPSRPASPEYDENPHDVMMSNGDFMPRSLESRRTQQQDSRDALIDIDDDFGGEREPNSAPPSPRLRPEGMQRHRAMTLAGEVDVCFPDDMSELPDDDMGTLTPHPDQRRRRRRREWPQLWVLDEWSREEKEARDGERRAKKINEPVLVGGRLRPRNSLWHREEEDAPYRYTYFNEEFESTIHAQTISELVQPGGTFRELFIPDPPEIIESSESSEDEEEPSLNGKKAVSPKPAADDGVPVTRLSSMLSDVVKPSSKEGSGKASRTSGEATPQKVAPTPPKASHTPPPKSKKYGPRPTFWLDVLSPTDQEMRVLCKTFGIHALTSEDVMMQEAREKVELFRNYYFINYRTFEQDPNSEDYLEPVNMYVCVFRHGIITFHFSQVPHPANVRRRIRQLTDYLILSADWISYAIIDDVTDVYQPLITSIEEEVDDIDDLILNALQSTNELSGEVDAAAPSMSGPGKDNKRPASINSEKSVAAKTSGIDVLRRIGECRKKTTSLYRLLGQKADVIKGFAKRCNEQWEVAPRSEIGLYLGDIQDHIITMSSNLSHYETSLSRAHSNYLAQVNIRMGERQESTADILGKLTVIGTIVLPMNVICGMWGMNVMVPGQEIENLWWFWGITAFMGVFAIVCFYWCKKVYKIV